MPRRRANARSSTLLPAAALCCAVFIVMLGACLGAQTDTAAPASAASAFRRTTTAAAGGASHHRKLQQAPGGPTNASLGNATGPPPREAVGFQQDTFQQFMSLFLEQVGAPKFFFDHFVFSRFASAFVFSEQVAIQEAAVALGQSLDKETGFVTYQPKQFYADAAIGGVQDIGVSAIFIASDFADLGEDTFPTLGNQYSIPVARGVVNVPARRRRIFQADLELGKQHLREEMHRRRSLLAAEETGASAAEGAEAHAEAEGDPVIFNKAVTITPAQVVALTRLGFFDKFAETLPEHLRANLTSTIKRNLRSVEEFMQAKNITEADVRAAGGPAPPPAPGAEATGRSTLKSARRRAEEAAMNATATGGEGGVGVTAITYPNWADITKVPFVDIEFNIAIVLQPNVVGAGLKITPLAWRLGANGFLAQSFKVAPLLIGFQQTTVQSLLEKAGVVVNGTSQLLRGDAEGAAGNAATITQEIWTSIKGLPTVAVVAFDVYIREQLSINGGDIATII